MQKRRDNVWIQRMTLRINGKIKKIAQKERRKGKKGAVIYRRLIQALELGWNA